MSVGTESFDYIIHEGDGMYLAPENRVDIWSISDLKGSKHGSVALPFLPQIKGGLFS